MEKDYLEQALKFHESHPLVGRFGGKSIPVFESDPPNWFFYTGINLGCQDYGNEVYVSEYYKNRFKVNGYPEKAPIGTGMVITKEAFLAYVNDVKNNFNCDDVKLLIFILVTLGNNVINFVALI